MNVHWFSSQSLLPLISFIFKRVACLRARSEEFGSQVPPTQLPVAAPVSAVTFQQHLWEIKKVVLKYQRAADGFGYNMHVRASFTFIFILCGERRAHSNPRKAFSPNSVLARQGKWIDCFTIIFYPTGSKLKMSPLSRLFKAHQEHNYTINILNVKTEVTSK